MRVLLAQQSGNFGGSTISGHLVARGMRDAGWEVCVAVGFEGTYVPRLREEGFRVELAPHESWLRTRSWPGFVRRLLSQRTGIRGCQELIREFRPDVVYLNSLVSLAAAVAARREKVPCVWHIRELFDDVGGEMRVPPIVGKQIARRIVRRFSTRRVAISRAVATNVLSPSDQDTVAIVPNAVEDAFFCVKEDAGECRQMLGLPLDKTIVGVPGTLRPVKGLSFFLETAARLVSIIPDCVFAISGSGEAGFSQELRQQARRLGLESSVRFLGTVPDMPRFYRACDIACVPSKSESFGRTVIEAFAVGTPVVATAVGGICEIIEDGRTGVLAPYGDVGRMTDALVRLLHDPGEREALARRALEKAGAEYTTTRHCRRVNAVVCEAADESRRRHAG